MIRTEDRAQVPMAGQGMGEIGQKPKGRIEAVDIARGVALVAMASYHLIWDLEMFQYLAPGTAAHGWPKLYARAIASSFLFLVGFSLVLAHWPVFKPEKFLRRLGVVVAAAAAVTIATYVAFPDAFVFYGILHAIAVSSVLALPFLRLPPVLTLIAAIIVLAVPQFVALPAFDPKWLAWIGLSQAYPRALDFVPLFPWLAPVLFGVAVARLAISSGLLARMATWHPLRHAGVRPLDFIGRHSLVFYLLHQPVLIALVWVFAQIAPPDQLQAYRASCEQSCGQLRDAALCERFCACTAERLVAEDLLEELQSGRLDPASDARIQAMAEQCTRQAEGR